MNKRYNQSGSRDLRSRFWSGHSFAISITVPFHHREEAFLGHAVMERGAEAHIVTFVASGSREMQEAWRKDAEGGGKI